MRDARDALRAPAAICHILQPGESRRAGPTRYDRRMRVSSWSLVLSVVAVSSGPAAAQPGELPPEATEETVPPPPPVAEPAVAPAPPPPVAIAPAVQTPTPPTTVDRGVIEDANSGRSWLAPTALTPPAGTWSFSDFELLVVGGSYAITDQLQISATTLLPVVEEMPFVGMLSGKFQVARAGRLRAAGQITVTHFREGEDSATAGTVGGALTLCLDDDCYSHLTGYLGAGLASEDQTSVPFLASAALAVRVAKRVKVLFEADTGFVVGDIDALAEGFLGWYGVRFTSKSIGVDLGFAKPFCDGCEDSGLPMGLPFIAFTFRDFRDGE